MTLAGHWHPKELKTRHGILVHTQCRSAALQRGYKGRHGLLCSVLRKYFTRLWNKGRSHWNVSRAKTTNTTVSNHWMDRMKLTNEYGQRCYKGCTASLVGQRLLKRVHPVKRSLSLRSNRTSTVKKMVHVGKEPEHCSKKEWHCFLHVSLLQHSHLFKTNSSLTLDFSWCSSIWMSVNLVLSSSLAPCRATISASGFSPLLRPFFDMISCQQESMCLTASNTDCHLLCSFQCRLV